METVGLQDALLPQFCCKLTLCFDNRQKNPVIVVVGNCAAVAIPEFGNLTAAGVVLDAVVTHLAQLLEDERVVCILDRTLPKLTHRIWCKHRSAFGVEQVALRVHASVPVDHGGKFGPHPVFDLQRPAAAFGPSFLRACTTNHTAGWKGVRHVTGNNELRVEVADRYFYSKDGRRYASMMLTRDGRLLSDFMGPPPLPCRTRMGRILQAPGLPA